MQSLKESKQWFIGKKEQTLVHRANGIRERRQY